jgi:outer membrane receptor for ferrienterochelin and colicin
MKFFQIISYFLVVLCVLCLNTLFAQDTLSKPDKKDSTTLYTSNIEELYKLKPIDKGEASISIAGFKATTLRESPGIVTLILGDEIRHSGAKDLFDVFRNVPGFDFALDVTPTISVRGNTAHEAKLLLLLDGQQINDISLGYSFVLQRFPLANIDRIEIIRGAGSAIYGGMAGLAVINIITKTPTTAQEVGFSSTVGTTTPTTLMRNNIEAYSLTKFNNGLEVSLSGYRLDGKPTDRNLVGGLYEDLIDFERRSSIKSTGFNVGIKFKKLDIRLLQNTYETALPQLGNARVNVSGLFFNIGYRFDVSEKFVLYSKITVKEQIPYFFTDIPLLPTFLNPTGFGRIDLIRISNTKDRRIAFNAYGIYQASENIAFTIGTESYLDNVRYIDPSQSFSNGTQINYNNIGLFAEANIKSKVANITVGGRFDKYTNVDAVVVPRIAITRAFKNTHVKLLYTQAFKTPTVLNLEYKTANTTMLPERYQLIEFETGLRIGERFQVNINAYDIKIQNFIIRNDINTTITGVAYLNLGESGTRGIEGEGRYNQKWGYIKVGYSFYQTTAVQKELFLTGLSTVNSGIPAQKASLQAHIKLNKDISINPNVLYLTNKFRNNTSPTDTFSEVQEYPAELHLSCFVNYDNFLLKNLSFGVGVYNITNEQFFLVPWKVDQSSRIVQTMQGRELYFRMSYNLRN